MNLETSKCELCHNSCSKCSGALDTDCSVCKSGLYMDNSRCVQCCSSGDDVALQSDITTECCKCATPDGPCMNSDRIRSIESMDKEEIKLTSNQKLFGVMNQPITVAIYGIIFVIIIVALLFVVPRSFLLRRPDRDDSYKINYQVLTASYPRSSQLINQDDIESDDEVTLFHSTNRNHLAD